VLVSKAMIPQAGGSKLFGAKVKVKNIKAVKEKASDWANHQVIISWFGVEHAPRTPPFLEAAESNKLVSGNHFRRFTHNAKH